MLTILAHTSVSILKSLKSIPKVTPHKRYTSVLVATWAAALQEEVNNFLTFLNKLCVDQLYYHGMSFLLIILCQMKK